MPPTVSENLNTETSAPDNASEVSLAERARIIQLAESNNQGLKERHLTLIEPGGTRFFAELRELWDYRELIWNFVSRDLTVRYRQTILGVGWAIIQPLAMMVVLTIFVGKIGHMGVANQPYALFSFASLLLWQYFSAAIGRCSNSLLAVGNVLKKVYFPRLAAPVASVIPPMVDFAVAFTILLGLLLAYHHAITAKILLAPFFLLIAAAAAFGAGIWTAALSVKYRDMHYLVPFGLQLMFFASPIIYSTAKIPESLRPLYYLNPMVGAIEGFRWCVVGSDIALLQPILTSVIVSTVLVVTGMVYFRFARVNFADYV